MITIFRRASISHPGPEYELRIGRPSWDPASNSEWSAKFAYHNANGRVSRASPETPLDVLPELVVFAAETGVLSRGKVNELIASLRGVYPD
jgi:hypothetical protein